MNRYFFEIVECASDRYCWRLVAYRGGRRRVIARSFRDYRSPRKAAGAAAALQEIVGEAEIVYGFPRSPHHTFHVLRDVLPLPVGTVGSAEEFRPLPFDAASLPRQTAGRSTGRGGAAPVPLAQQATAAEKSAAAAQPPIPAQPTAAAERAPKHEQAAAASPAPTEKQDATAKKEPSPATAAAQS